MRGGGSAGTGLGSTNCSYLMLFNVQRRITRASTEETAIPIVADMTM